MAAPGMPAPGIGLARQPGPAGDVSRHPTTVNTGPEARYYNNSSRIATGDPLYTEEQVERSRLRSVGI